jgi:hypothetical protein
MSFQNKLTRHFPNGHDALFISLLAILVFLFYPDLFFAKIASLAGDHWEQHYPWAYHLSSALKSFRLPFWTNLIGSGFPIAAEGQIGVFYVPNLILHFLLPFKWAYSYQNVVHFAISGSGTYFYARSIQLKPVAAFVAAVGFLFGTAYGGAYYNITSLKTLAWFPVMLFLFERLRLESTWRSILGLSFLLALVFSFIIQAGYLQVAVYGLLFFGLYAVLRMTIFSGSKRESIVSLPRLLAGLMFATVVGIVIAAPQIVLTFNLAILSNRLGAAEEYAYVGSLFPGAMATLIYPMFQGVFRGNSIFIGIFSVLLVCFSIYSKEARKQAAFRAWLTLGIVALLLALGEWSPLYVAIVKITHFYSFRTPAKFLVFICFALSILAGYGYQAALGSQKAGKVATKLIRKVSRTINILVGAFLALMAGLWITIQYFRPVYVQLGEVFVERFFYGRPGHPHGLETYYQKFDDTLSVLVDVITPFQLWNAFSYALLVVVLGFSISLVRAKRVTQTWLIAGLVFLILELFIFSWYDIRKDIVPYSRYESKSKIVTYLTQEAAQGYVGRIHGLRKLHQKLPLIPSSNMLYQISDIGVYSPLVTKRYFESMGALGNINDSNSASEPDPAFVLSRLPILSFLNVSHLISVDRIQHPKLKLVASDGDTGPYLYQNTSRPEFVHFTTKVESLSSWENIKARLMSEGYQPNDSLLLERSEYEKLMHTDFVSQNPILGGRTNIEVLSAAKGGYLLRTDGAGFFTVPVLYDRGWVVKINNREASALKGYGLFLTVQLPEKGTYRITYQYEPFRFLKQASHVG